jgi:sugar fermentation stimulation protein A
MELDYAYRFDPPLQKANFIERPHRFAVRAALDHDDRRVEAHLPDPGRLRELLLPGAELWLQPASRPGRKTSFSARLVRSVTGELVGVDTQLPNRLVAQALRDRELSPFTLWELAGAEVTHRSSRFDFLLRDAAGQPHYLEVKSVSLVEDGVALFPDAVTARGRRHLAELTELRRTGHGASVLFVVQRGDASRVRANARRDPDFAEAMAVAARAGVQFQARSCRFDPLGAAWLDEVPVDPGD